MRVLLADQEGEARRALATLLHYLEGVSLVGEVGSRADLAAALRHLRPDILVIDDRFLRSVGHTLTGFGPIPSPPRVIVVGMIDEPAFAARAHRLGAEAWVAKDRAAEELPRLLRAR